MPDEMSAESPDAAPERASQPPRVAIRAFRQSDIETVAGFEAEIAVASFADEAVTDLAHYRKKLGKLLKYGDDWTQVLVVSDTSGAERIAGWAWVAKRQNFITGETYADFRSLYVDGASAGPAAAVGLLRAVLAYCEEEGFSRIVGRTATSNEAMRSLYRLAGFEERHVVYEMDIGPGMSRRPTR
ncbi:MAG: GNAT family N-acetyltransferase [Rhizobiaceae bacterium]|nr:GNAT family N-acetyltransferase [Rhizobiaceae bacterium]